MSLKGFIVFEGIDAAGTTTQSKLLFDFLISKGIRTKLTCEPTSSPIGKIIRSSLKNDSELDKGTLPYLFAADRYNHVFNKEDGIESFLHKTDSFLISDRYLFSSLAYQSIDFNFEYVLKLNSYFPLPELTFFIDLPVEVSIQRIKNRTAEPDSFENIDFQKKVRDQYETCFSYFSGKTKIVTLDGTLPKMEIHSRICEHTALLLDKKNRH
ncbi:MAG: dTMP kinase [Spirochaetia bacterium]|nr:dTMP kinase [Spirochaetia bacterium]